MIFCVGGRINVGNLPKESENQMIASESHCLSDSIIMDSHQLNFHKGIEQTLGLLQIIY